MAVLGELLFYRRDQVGLDDVLRSLPERLAAVVDGLPDEFFREKSDDAIAAHVLEKENVKPLIVDFSSAVANIREVKIDVRDHFSGELIRVPGLEATKSIPFSGWPELWRLRPNAWTLNPPRGELRGDQLVVGISVRTDQTGEVTQYIEQTTAQISEYLRTQEVQIHQHNSALPGLAAQRIRQRRQRMSAALDLLKKLGG